MHAGKEGNDSCIEQHVGQICARSVYHLADLRVLVECCKETLCALVLAHLQMWEQWIICASDLPTCSTISA